MSLRKPDALGTLAASALALRVVGGHLANVVSSRVVSGETARSRRLQRLNRTPLPFLFDVHPEARSAPRIELGLVEIPVDEIAGTAVGGGEQRGSDFRPLPDRRGRNWQARWARILRAMERLETLPAIEVVATADGYWVVDGHNRVAAALYTGQVAIDATVTHLRLPGSPVGPRPGRLAPLLESQLDERTAFRSFRRGAPEVCAPAC